MRAKALAATVALVLALCGCTSGERGIKRAEESPKPNVGQRFLCDKRESLQGVHDYYEFDTVVDSKTGVTYLVWHYGYGRSSSQGGITVLVDRDGKPIISEEVSE
jgi:hypothetical protein